MAALAVAVSATCAVCAGAVLLPQTDAPPSRRQAAANAPQPASPSAAKLLPPSPAAKTTAQPARAPSGVPDAASLAAVTTAAPSDRVRALRELERADPSAAVAEATRLARDPVRLVQINAVAVLARSPAPEAAQALAQLDPDARRLALSLKARR